MLLARTIPGIGALPELQTFECRACAVVITQEKRRAACAAHPQAIAAAE